MMPATRSLALLFVLTLVVPILVGTLVAVASLRVRLEVLPFFLAASALVAFAIIVSRGSVACLAAMLSLAFIGWMPVMVSIGTVDFRGPDLLYLALAMSVAVRRSPATVLENPEAQRAFRSAGILLALFTGLAGLSLLHVAFSEPDFLTASIVSWLRFAQTASLAGFAYVTLRSDRDIARMLQVMSFAGVGAVLAALWEVRESEAANVLTARYGGLLSVNTLGLVAGVLVVAALYPPGGMRIWNRALVGLAGIVGLALSKSVTSMVATVCVIVLGYALNFGRTPHGNRWAFKLLGAGLAGSLLVLGAIQIVRPSALPTSIDFAGSSTLHRIIVETAGWEIFAENPLLGVGWRRSSSPAVIGDPSLALDLRERFSEANPQFFPDLNPTSVHSAYVQVLAELGVAGLLLLAWGFFRVLQGIRLLSAAAGRRPLRLENIRFLALALGLILLWWQTNPIYGGQTETIGAATFVGTLAALTVRGRNPGEPAGDEEAQPR